MNGIMYTLENYPDIMVMVYFELMGFLYINLDLGSHYFPIRKLYRKWGDARLSPTPYLYFPSIILAVVLVDLISFFAFGVFPLPGVMGYLSLADTVRIIPKNRIKFNSLKDFIKSLDFCGVQYCFTMLIAFVTLIGYIDSEMVRNPDAFILFRRMNALALFVLGLYFLARWILEQRKQCKDGTSLSKRVKITMVVKGLFLTILVGCSLYSLFDVRCFIPSAFLSAGYIGVLTWRASQQKRFLLRNPWLDTIIQRYMGAFYFFHWGVLELIIQGGH